MEISYEIVQAALASQNGYPRRVSFRIRRGDTAWNSASTKYPLYGPACVDYVQFADGAIDTTVSQ